MRTPVDPSPTMPRDRKDFIHVGFDRLRSGDVVATILDAEPAGPFRYVVTPNVDHMIRIDADPAIAALYRNAWLCINDSRILGALARIAGIALPVTPGADLVVDLLRDRRLARDTPILVVGGHQGLAEELGARLGLTAIRQHRPPMNLLGDAGAFEAVLDAIEDGHARLVFLAVGSPQQEFLAAAVAARGIACGIGLCVGAGLEFLVGSRRRAPLWMQRAGLEWAFRLGTEPRRLARRYLVDGPRIFAIYLAYLFARRTVLQRN